MVKQLDENLCVYAQRILEATGIDVSSIKGGGAAGGMGAGAFAFLGAELKQGIGVILDLLDFEAVSYTHLVTGTEIPQDGSRRWHGFISQTRCMRRLDGHRRKKLRNSP